MAAGKYKMTRRASMFIELMLLAWGTFSPLGILPVDLSLMRRKGVVSQGQGWPSSGNTPGEGPKWRKRPERGSGKGREVGETAGRYFFQSEEGTSRDTTHSWVLGWELTPSPRGLKAAGSNVR